MRDAMRSPFQAKHINDSMYMENLSLRYTLEINNNMFCMTHLA